MATRKAASKAYMLLGQCLPCVKEKASKIRVKRMDLDENLLMYFRKDEIFYAHDPEKKCKVGDIVLIEELPNKLTKLITHKVKEVVYPFGDITDPVTGKKVVVSQYRDDIDKEIDAYGRLESTFDYKKAPPRGWQEDKKDFTHRETYIKYHESGEDQPYAV
ncbi:28S ribosomal protein S17, mitochondrial-like [Ctenocephalides felis]|uniref:28S ribosomal protein S17, mitochondrial-like n=1 Tax=Ctenocephalides felis TaxID=7515 RepID=UPI000E6E3E10|nr:28S ribosomal protein S17, mitochondrial-like [Ctenocephalides felis]XP_026462541.1 28S ribosomal protein S17, mitochondrial-like [Ctenocephalides felis]